MYLVLYSYHCQHQKFDLWWSWTMGNFSMLVTFWLLFTTLYPLPVTFPPIFSFCFCLLNHSVFCFLILFFCFLEYLRPLHVRQIKTKIDNHAPQTFPAHLYFRAGNECSKIVIRFSNGWKTIIWKWIQASAMFSFQETKLNIYKLKQVMIEYRKVLAKRLGKFINN